MPSSKPPLVVIAGPTASGKSALALALAQQIKGVIVNADSAQIYRDLKILSAAPTGEELKWAEHRLYGVQDGSLPCSAADWAALAVREILAIHSSGRTPILVGGTGLYLRTLLEGIAPIPPIDPSIRARVRAASLEENRQKLEELDPNRQAGSTRETRRVSTARLRSSCRPVETSPIGTSGARAESGAEIELRALVLLPPRKWLYTRCDERFARDDRNGRGCRSRGTPDTRTQPGFSGHACDWSAGTLALSSARSRSTKPSRRASRRLVAIKRQYTWFAHQPPSDWPRFREALDVDRLGEALALL